ncbi:hypothetical protein CY35_12G008600 [Sphagnum magellanicum]|nr:hypothetical protein CY35_12G008600 [Sphagnum magellanicum]
MERSKIESDFYPIGNYVFMEQDSNPWGDKETRYIRHYVNDESVKMQWKLGEVKLGIADVQYHEIASYRSVMAATSLIDGPKFYSPVPEPPYEVNLVVSTPAPTITSARLRCAQGSRRIITITGTNLLFLREPVSLNGKEPWQTCERRDDKLVILEPSKSAAETAPTLVVIFKTAFGQADKVVEEIKETSRGHRKQEARTKSGRILFIACSHSFLSRSLYQLTPDRQTLAQYTIVYIAIK